ncbi:circadian clock KaiB family protein [Legionella londiniensis]|uniref:KaiB-like protein 2 n=1 Tax=Legionella londiniensis TaxID=45068 RepID=A0A0W0VNZ6_9GAMM|nr:circadian clock KaiB family protein [Legionella londiniensis]KTD21768.1 KaiB-like protein 2 [Legionella londiniensis]STX92144.1 KaiB-like protein 2 [Legionella londiniensis]
MAKMKLKLYVIGGSLIARRAIKNLTELCRREEIAKQCDMEIIDLREHEGLAEREKILATPILIKEFPPPERRIIGDLSNMQKILGTLELGGEGHEK